MRCKGDTIVETYLVADVVKQLKVACVDGQSASLSYVEIIWAYYLTASTLPYLYLQAWLQWAFLSRIHHSISGFTH